MFLHGRNSLSEELFEVRTILHMFTSANHIVFFGYHRFIEHQLSLKLLGNVYVFSDTDHIVTICNYTFHDIQIPSIIARLTNN